VKSSTKTNTEKQAIKSCDVIEEILEPAAEEETIVLVEPCCKYENAIELISAAIESLAEVAKDDQIAKDSIANLGVVMLDLKGACNQ